MAAMPVPPAPVLPTDAAPLSEPARVLNTFFSPSKTFTDLRQNASWWLPFLITAIVSVSFVYVVDQKGGYQKVVENQIRTQPKQADRIERRPADQRDKTLRQQTSFTKGCPDVLRLFILGSSSLLTSLDVFTIWTLVLTAIGITCITKIKSSSAYAVVFGWYGVVVLIGVAFAAAFA